MERMIARISESIPLYDASGQMMNEVDGEVRKYEFGSRLGWSEEEWIHSVAFVWKENVDGLRGNGPEHACVLLRGDEAKDTFEGVGLAVGLVDRTIRLQEGSGGVYHVATGTL